MGRRSSSLSSGGSEDALRSAVLGSCVCHTSFQQVPLASLMASYCSKCSREGTALCERWKRGVRGSCLAYAPVTALEPNVSAGAWFTQQLSSQGPGSLQKPWCRVFWCQTVLMSSGSGSFVAGGAAVPPCCAGGSAGWPFVITPGSPSGVRDEEAQQGESWGRCGSRGHRCEMWAVPPTSVESLSCAVKGGISSRCGALRAVSWSLRGFVSQTKTTLSNCVSWCCRAQEARWRARRSTFSVRAYRGCSGLEEACVQKSLPLWGIAFLKDSGDQHTPRSRIFPSLPIAVVGEGHHRFKRTSCVMSEAYPAPTLFAGNEDKCVSLLHVAALRGVGHLRTWRGFSPYACPPKMSS